MNYRITKDKFFDEKERQELIVKLSVWLTTNPRDAVMILILMFTGCRAQELLNIRPSDIHLGNSSIYIRGLKGSNDRTVTLPEWVLKFLVIAPSLATETVFPLSYERLVQIFKKLEMKKPLKALRHTFAMELYEKTQDLFLVKMALGHRSISSTLVYVDFIDSEQRLKKIKTLGLYGLSCE